MMVGYGGSTCPPSRLQSGRGNGALGSLFAGRRSLRDTHGTTAVLSRTTRSP